MTHQKIAVVETDTTHVAEGVEESRLHSSLATSSRG
jgi:hypothetical protein